MSKLVRNKIPKIMELRGQNPQTRILENDDEFLCFLHKKMLEEVAEFINASETKNSKEAKEELADILEVIDTICKLKKYSLISLKKLKDKKRKKIGGFNKKIILL